MASIWDVMGRRKAQPQGLGMAWTPPPKPTTTTPTPTRRTSTPTTQPQQQQRQQSRGFSPPSFDMSSFMNQFQMPQMPQASQGQIADWLARAKNEAGLQFDPQLLGIQQSLETALLGSEEARGGIDPAYESATRNINEWLQDTLGAEDRRWFARGMGRGGGSRMAQAEITGKAGQGIADIETERARVLTDIEKQESLLKKQAGEKEAGVATARGQFVSSRSAGLRENWEAQKAQLDQQAFANQRSIVEIGLTAESQRFSQQIQQAQFNADTAYRDELMALEKYASGLSLDAPTRETTTDFGTASTQFPSRKSPNYEIAGGSFVQKPVSAMTTGEYTAWELENIKRKEYEERGWMS